MGMQEDRLAKEAAVVAKVMSGNGGSLMMNLDTVKAKKVEKTEE